MRRGEIRLFLHILILFLCLDFAIFAHHVPLGSWDCLQSGAVSVKRRLRTTVFTMQMSTRQQQSHCFLTLKTIASSQSTLCILHSPIVHSGGEQAGGAWENKRWEGNKTRRRKGREAVGSDFRSFPTESTLCVFYLIISITIFVEKIS